MHGVLTTDLIGKGWNLELIFHAAHHVQIGLSRLNHNHVRALFDIEGHLVQGFIAVC